MELLPGQNQVTDATPDEQRQVSNLFENVKTGDTVHFPDGRVEVARKIDLKSYLT